MFSACSAPLAPTYQLLEPQGPQNSVAVNDREAVLQHLSLRSQPPIHRAALYLPPVHGRRDVPVALVAEGGLSDDPEVLFRY